MQQPDLRSSGLQTGASLVLIIRQARPIINNLDDERGGFPHQPGADMTSTLQRRIGSVPHGINKSRFELADGIPTGRTDAVLEKLVLSGAGKKAGYRHADPDWAAVHRQ
jgi:hypothetical protein